MANIFSEKPLVEIVAVPGRDGTDIPIDDRLSDTSENPVQNKVVKQAIDNAVSATEDYATQAVEAAYGQLDEIKQDVLDDSGAGQNIKTINGESILGTGNLEVGSQIEVDDALNPTSENPVQNRALYQAFNELNNDVIGEVSRLANRVYGYTHEAIVTDDLENDYNLIINGGYQRLYNPPMDWDTEYASYYYLDGMVYRLNSSATWDWNVEYYKKYTPNSDLANVSAVGMLAVLNHGVYTAVPTQPDDWTENYDKYFYASGNGYLFNTEPTWNPNRSYYSYSGDAVRTQGNKLFINGEESDGYTFRGVNAENGIEFVKIWYFENNTPIDISSKADFAILELIIKTINYMPTIDNDYLNASTVRVIGIYNGVVTTNNINHLSVINNSLTTIPTNIRSVYSGIETLPTNSGLGNKTALKSVYLPNLKTIMSNPVNNYYNGFRNNISLTDIYFPKLESIGDSDQWTGTFTNVPIINFPESVKTIGTAACVNNGGIHMNCSKATNIKTNWCYGTPTVFTMVANWEATINISTAAKKWDAERFTTIPAEKDATDTYYLYNLLKTVEYTPNAHVITIPQAYVSDDLIDAYLEIGWDLLGA